MLKLFLLLNLFPVFLSCSGKTDRRDTRSHQHHQSIQHKISLLYDDKLNISELSNCYKADITICAIEIEIARLTNIFRAEQGASGDLLHETRISYSARAWSESMAHHNSLSHEGFPQQRTQSIEREFGLQEINLTGENVAMNSGTNKTPTEIAQVFVSMWIHSTGHRSNILQNSRNCLGVGLARNPRGLYFATQIFGVCGS